MSAPLRIAVYGPESTGKTGKVVNPGSSKDSLIMQRVQGQGAPPMPPIGQRLSANEVAVLREWIDEGARPRANATAARLASNAAGCTAASNWPATNSSRVPALESPWHSGSP